jgi:hypothetical protein
MITEYKGYTLTDRDDFKVQEFGESLTLFLFDPALFEIDSQEMREFGAALSDETNAAFTLLGTEIEKGIITLIINSTVEHFYTNEFLKDSIIRFIFDHRSDDDLEQM